ncbi:unnamed protein product [Linum tenue]|uniref:AB hydrolase-1 domain-containing protein n=1 Tax=Linum tenue TaxID=586396 RepID=A0AAV0KEG6_9ROSI|nr:unnamed protein product [Linum tenue]CAI0420623.1 unnamed protein product [Linum tenue]
MLFRITVILLIGLLTSAAYQAFRPPPPKICGTPGGPPVTAPRIKLRDGRHLAYKEHGLPKDVAKHKIVFVHGFTSCRLDPMIVTNLTPEVIEELGVYVVTFDRPGYGESDPDPNRTPKSLALDIEELADGLGLGSRFYVMGKSMGGQVVWGCLKYIPQRLAGAALIAPVINYWWPGFPADLCKEAYNLQLPQDQWALRVAHHAPWLTYWWNTQKLFPSSGVISRKRETMSRQDIELVSTMASPFAFVQKEATQQGEFESLHRDMMIGFGKWEFDPMDLENPFPNNEGSVHLWQGDDDKKVPVILQRYIAQKLPWIHYHELPGGGHVLHFVPGLIEGVLRALLRGGK